MCLFGRQEKQKVVSGQLCTVVSLERKWIPLLVAAWCIELIARVLCRSLLQNRITKIQLFSTTIPLHVAAWRILLIAGDLFRFLSQKRRTNIELFFTTIPLHAAAWRIHQIAGVYCMCLVAQQEQQEDIFGVLRTAISVETRLRHVSLESVTFVQ